MKRFILKITIVMFTFVLGLGCFAGAPQQASAAVIKNGVLSIADRLCPYRAGCREDVYTVRLTAGQTYVIDLMSKSFDTYLYLESGTGTRLRSNDDGGIGLNSRIVFTPSVSGNYRIVVTSFGRGATGSYTMRVSP